MKKKTLTQKTEMLRSKIEKHPFTFSVYSKTKTKTYVITVSS